MWQPMETCERCGSDNIQLVEDHDDSVGYSGEEWRCMRCGVNCEYWMPTDSATAAAKVDDESGTSGSKEAA